MILVVDITKGMQTQTAECLVIGEITCSKMIVVLNKIDSIPLDKREKTIEKVFSILMEHIGVFLVWKDSRGGANIGANYDTGIIEIFLIFR